MNDKTQKIKYYSLDNILKKKALYNVIFGKRSNGKTYACLKKGIEDFWKNGKEMAYIRRWAEDCTGKRAMTIFDGLVANNVIREITKGEWTNVYYHASKWYLSRYDEDGKRVSMENPFCYGFALSNMEHDKGSSYPNIYNIVFDEFITRTMYLPNEFVLFMNVLSTIIRHRDNVIIYMLGNTVTKYGCIYFSEMGLINTKKMKQGDIDLYRYGDSDLTVAVEYTDYVENTSKADTYFAFNNPKLAMITTGAWEMELYPHCPVKYDKTDILYTYFIEYNDEMLQCEIVSKNDTTFTYIHRKTTPLKEEPTDLIYCQRVRAEPNYRQFITKPTLAIEKRIAMFFKTGKVFYQDNEIGEIVRSYLVWCGKVV